MKTQKFVKFMAALAVFGALSTGAHACVRGEGAKVAQIFIGKKAACALDDASAAFKNANPAYKAFEESASAATRNAAAGAALYYGGPIGLAAGRAALGVVNNGLNQLGQQHDNRHAQQTQDWYAWCRQRGASYNPHTHQCVGDVYGHTQQHNPYPSQLSFCHSRGFRNYNPYTNMCFN